jgi:HK97 family phage major capsid protein
LNEPQDELITVIAPAEIEVRDAAQRLVDMRLLPWDTEIDTVQGRERFTRGAFEGTDPSTVYLYGPEHEMKLGVGQDGQPRAIRVPIGRATDISDHMDGPRATFKVARTAGGDEALALMADKIISGVSVEFAQVAGGTEVKRENGRRVRIHNRARLVGATPTHRPAYGDQAAVLAVRSHQEEEPIMGETVEPTAGNPAETAAILAAISEINTRAAAEKAERDRFLEKLEKLEELNRSDITIPGASEDPKPKLDMGHWVDLVVRVASGDRIPAEQMRTLDDVITTDNIGVVPPAYLTEIIGVIDPSRPFLSSTRRLSTPSSGTKLIVPIINQRPEAGKQSSEKQEVASTKTLIGVEEFGMVTIAGAGDLSIQLIKRSSPEFLSLWIELLAEQYARESESAAITALADSIGGFGNASAMNPANLLLGDAWVASFDAIRRGPDTIWLSTQAVGEFIDAKATTTNQPMYSNINLNATAAGGVSGSISGLRAVHVPMLDVHGAYALVGPSSGFAWAEDGTYTLQVDNAAKAGRDVALVGMLWSAPWYPAAFTAYNVAS